MAALSNRMAASIAIVVSRCGDKNRLSPFEAHIRHGSKRVGRMHTSTIRNQIIVCRKMILYQLVRRIEFTVADIPLEFQITIRWLFQLTGNLVRYPIYVSAALHSGSKECAQRCHVDGQAGRARCNCALMPMSCSFVWRHATHIRRMFDVEQSLFRVKCIVRSEQRIEIAEQNMCAPRKTQSIPSPFTHTICSVVCIALARQF